MDGVPWLEGLTRDTKVLEVEISQTEASIGPGARLQGVGSAESLLRPAPAAGGIVLDRFADRFGVSGRSVRTFGVRLLRIGAGDRHRARERDCKP